MRSSLLSAWLCANLAAASSKFTTIHTLGNLLRYIPKQQHLTAPDIRLNFPNGTFEQYIDHNNPSLGTFSQSYYYSAKHCKKPGCPVVLFAPQEANLSLYYPLIGDSFLPGAMAEKLGAAVIALEHRFWGNSSPFPQLTTENLQLLTLPQAIADLTNFAQNVKPPFAPRGQSSAEKTPWVLMGVSYSGALTGWTEVLAPGTFWAYHASSAVVQSIGNFWEYFVAEQQNMPQNCSADISRVIAYLDNVGMHGSLAKQQQLKTMFGFKNLPYWDDFSAALVTPLYLWQSSDLDENVFDPFCDAIEGVNANSTTIPGASGVGLTAALANYAKYMKTVVVPGYCENTFGNLFHGKMNVDCFDSHNPKSPIYTDVTLSNPVDRQWEWMLCNEPFGWWQTGSPNSQTTLVSRFVTAEYFQKMCSYYFPTQNGFTFGSARGQTENDVNMYTTGWTNTNSTRVNWVNGGWDPWRPATLSSPFRPGGPLGSTISEPINIIAGGFHGSDWGMNNAKVNPSAKQVIDFSLNQIHEWVQEWTPN